MPIFIPGPLRLRGFCHCQHHLSVCSSICPSFCLSACPPSMMLMLCSRNISCNLFIFGRVIRQSINLNHIDYKWDTTNFHTFCEILRFILLSDGHPFYKQYFLNSQKDLIGSCSTFRVEITQNNWRITEGADGRTDKSQREKWWKVHVWFSLATL